MTFDARAIKQLKPGKHLTSTSYPGLRILATASGFTWTYRYKSPVDEKLRQIKIGSWPTTSLHVAAVEWERLRKIREDGRDPALEAKQVKSDRRAAVTQKKAKKEAQAYTVLKVALDYWEGHVDKNRAKKGATEVLRMFNTMLGESGAIPAAELTRAQAFDLIQSHSDKPVNAGRLRSELGAAWDWAIDSGRLPQTAANWWRLILRGKLRSKGKKINGKNIGTAKRVLSGEEIGTLLRWLPNLSLMLQDTLTLYLWTCCRGAEIVTVEGREIQKEGDGIWWWTIPKSKTKNARHEDAEDLRVPLFGRAKAILLRRKEMYGDGWLFPAKRLDGSISHVEQKSIQSSLWVYQPYSQTTPGFIRPRLPVSHWAPHDLRRSSRTLLASMGCPDEVGESILGHMLSGVLGVYNRHSYDAERVEWLRRLSDRLEALAEVG